MTEFGEGGGNGRRGGKPWPDATADRPAVAGSSPAPPLHLLRPFTEWTDRRTGEPIKTVDEAESWVRHIADCGFDRFYTWTTRRVTRAAELEGGSVYFAARRRALFRMPIVEVESDGDGWAICMRPELVRTEQHAVGFVRGWRYLRDEDAPPDLVGAPAAGDEPPPGMAAQLREMGLA